jgi:PadR family transcriptional regulator, regulatory protein PadR
MSQPPVALLQGTLDAIVLKTLSWGPMHGYAIARWIQRVSDDVLCVEEGSLYPALYRMENRAWVKTEWGVSENNRRAKYYRLTAAGRRQLAAQTQSLEVFSVALGKIMSATAKTA